MNNQETFTLGIEEEFMIIDPVTRELQSHIQTIFDEGKTVLKENFKPEMHASVIETGTNICKNIQEARTEVTESKKHSCKNIRSSRFKNSSSRNTSVFTLERSENNRSSEVYGNYK